MNRRTQREAGDVMSWVVGVTAGLILGVTLLIATPQLMKAPQTEATKTGTATTMPETATQSTTADSTTAESGPTGSASTGTTTTPAPDTSPAPATDTAGTAAATTDAATTDPATPDATAAATTGAPAGEAAAGDSAAGQTVFAGNCAACHGANGQGQIGPSLVTADGPKAWTDAQFLTTLRDGKTPQRELSAAMPRFSEGQISDADVANIHAYLKTLN
ncbi:cytochrome c [Deinococcus sp.]|uniref:c-type cytochrome n=1 Tax=Deinococcus sp. TaxID=47478 RepID=UPI0025C5C57E|nr:cytochrome c [Deinococcus sp.]